MAVPSLSDPPDLGQSAKYSDYKTWLLDDFCHCLCSYCLLHNPDVQVEHYEPVSYAPGRQHDPTNLLLACPNCNRLKGDYHPAHTGRRRKPRDQTGHLVADVRVDDFGSLFLVEEATGKIAAVSGRILGRAAWNITLLKLDLPYRDEARRHLCDALAICDRLIGAIEGGARGKDRDAMEAALKNLLAGLRKQRLFFTTHELTIPPAVAAALDAVEDKTA